MKTSRATTSNTDDEEYRLIRINRTTPAPSILSTSTAEERYNNSEVVQALLTMQHHKCCYCEIHIAEWGLGKQVEHFRPKSKFKELMYDWNNLLLACGECNYAKLSKFPVSSDKEPLLLDPSDATIDPEDHIEFLVTEEQAKNLGYGSIELLSGIAVAREHSLKGRASIQTINLSGSHHVKRRGETLSKLQLCYSWLLSETKRVSVGNGNVQTVHRLKDELQEAVGADKAYAGLARTFCREHRLSKFGIRSNL